MTRGALVLCVALFIGATSAHAQPALPPTPQASTASGVTLVPADMYYLRDASRTPMRRLPAGTSVKVLAREGAWLLVVFTDPRFGDERGYVRAASLRHEGGDDFDARDGDVFSQRGFIDVYGQGYFQEATNDPKRLIGDALWREEIQLKPAKWLQFAAGLDVRADSYHQVEDEWRIDLEDRGIERPRVGTRRMTATITAGQFSFDAGKQFVRWGKADVLNPTDRFAPRDYLNVVDSQVLPVWAGRASLQLGQETFEAVYVPQLTPSRMPLLTQRWTVLPPSTNGLVIDDRGAVFPDQVQQGLRWNHVGASVETSLSVFDGLNHLPDIEAQLGPSGELALTRTFPRLKTYGADLAVPTRLVTVKAEAAYFQSPTSTSDEYVLYVVELERQSGEWLFDIGYAGEHVLQDRHQQSFAPERGLARSFVGRAAYTMGPRRSVTLEGLVRRDAKGAYVKGEYSEGLGQHWRLTVNATGLAGDDDDFLGQYRRNSGISGLLRLSF